MATRSIAAAVGAALIGLSAIAATATPAAADGFTFGFRIGEPVGGYYEYRDDRRPAYYPVYRERWAPQRRVKVCEPVWTTRKYLDAYGRVYKIVKVQEQSCRWARRNW